MKFESFSFSFLVSLSLLPLLYTTPLPTLLVDGPQSCFPTFSPRTTVFYNHTVYIAPTGRRRYHNRSYVNPIVLTRRSNNVIPNAVFDKEFCIYHGPSIDICQAYRLLPLFYGQPRS